MDADILQVLRYKLQKRVRRLNSVEDSEIFGWLLRQLWVFLHDHPIYSGIIADLCTRFPQDDNLAQQMLEKHTAQVGETEGEQAAIAYHLLSYCQEDPARSYAGVIGRRCGLSQSDDPLSGFRELYLEPFYEYLDEQIDDQRVLLATLRRFKHRCEWFRRDELYKLWQDGRRRGERLLNARLYEYLYDQGIEFYIEPVSASGEADLVSAQVGDERLVADGKVFAEAARGKQNVCKGFRQVYDYTVDYNEPCGYLVVFKTCPEDLRLALSGSTQDTPYFSHNNKTIYCLTVDIYPHEKSASERGILQAVEITEDDLVKAVAEEPLGGESE